MRKKNKKCNTGGPLTPPPDSTVAVLPYQIFPPSKPNPPKGTIKYGNNSSKSKSKDRFREKKTGGFLELLGNVSPILGAVSTGVNLVSTVANALNKDKQVISASPGYQDGGPLPTASQLDYVNKGTKNKYTTSPRGIEESGKRVLSKGSKGEEVRQLQTFLQNKGFYKGKVDGLFGSQTEGAVKAYQQWFNDNAKSDVSYVQDGKQRLRGRSNKIAVDGIVGDETRSALMYREMPQAIKETTAWQDTDMQFPTNIDRKHSVTDNRVMGSPDQLDYIYGPAMVGAAALLGWGISEAPAVVGPAGEQLIIRNAVNASRNFRPTPMRPPLNPTVPRGTPQPGGRYFQPKTPDAFGTRIGFETGGDLPLTNNSFQVKDNPNVTDGKFYPEYGAYLDHNEVVKNDFVFSDTLRSPISGEKFSKEALRLENSTKRAQRRLKVDPTDPHAKATIAHNEKTSSELAALQEHIATKMGLRGPTTHLQNGGPTDPMNPSNYQWLDPLSIYSLKPSDRFPSMRTQGVPPPQTGRHIPGPWENWMNYQTAVPAPIPTPAPTSTPAVPRARKPKVAAPAPAPAPTSTPAVDPRIQFLPRAQQDTPPPFGEQPIDLLPTPELGPQTFTQDSVLDSQVYDVVTTPDAKAANRFTTGDYIQMGALAGEFLPLLGGPEVEKVQVDSTPITKESYDVQQVLAQNQRNFSNVASSINTPSETLRRAILSQLDATKVNRDNQALTQYQQMNEGARVRYEDRLSNRRRFNVGQKNYTDNINAANRAAYRSSVQNAFTSLNNLGMALNERDMQKKQLALLEKRYSDVYDNIVRSLTNG